MTLKLHCTAKEISILHPTYFLYIPSPITLPNTPAKTPRFERSRTPYLTLLPARRVCLMHIARAAASP